jgi:glutathione transport system substrate-binding protein
VGDTQGLVDFDRDLKIRPVLAESWKVSPNGKEWTFALRKGVKSTTGGRSPPET